MDSPADPSHVSSEEAASIDALLASARHLGVDRLDAQLLVSHAVQRPRTWLLSHGDAMVSPKVRAEVTHRMRQRADGVPLSYLVGHREFHGITLQITPSVLDPRPDTETLVDWALTLVDAEPSRPWSVADLGTGSGAIALSIAHHTRSRAPAVHVTATDRSTAALAVARANVLALGLNVELLEGSWWQALAGRRFDLVLSNPPYIAEMDPHLAGLRHEPRSALVSGPDGLDDLRTLISGAAPHLNPGGRLLLEHGWDQGPAVAHLLEACGFGEVTHQTDLGGHIRCTGGTLLR